MKISTTSFGPQDIDPDTVITFPLGLPGFEEHKQYKLFHNEEYEDLRYLQSIGKAELGFSLMEPGQFGYEYEILLSDEELELLQASDADDLMVMFMIYKGSEEKEQLRSTNIPINANWRSPIIINKKTKIGLQKTLSKPTKTIKISGK